jgi:hypothetical protein
MPESGVTKHNYLFCQFFNPERGHEGERCDCFDTPSQQRTTLAKQRLARLRANRNVNRASTSDKQESAVASDPVVTLNSASVPKGTIQNIRSSSVTLRVLLIGTQSGKKISANTLLDSGAEGMIIDSTFAKNHSLTLRTLRTPLPVCNVNGTMNNSGPIRFTTIQTVLIQNCAAFHIECTEFYVISVATHDIIFGTDWLKAHNPELDWTSSRLTFTHCPSSCTLSSSPLVIQPSPSHILSMIISALKPILDNLSVTDEDHSAVAAIRFLELHRQFKESRPVLIRSKKTHSIALAPNLIPVKNLDHIPAQFQKYRTVFSEQASYCLPQH